jgi:hypothetical protein
LLLEGHVIVVTKKLIKVLCLASVYSPPAEGIEVEIPSHKIRAFRVNESSHVESTQAASYTDSGITCCVFVDSSIMDCFSVFSRFKIPTHTRASYKTSLKYPGGRLIIAEWPKLGRWDGNRKNI